MADAARNERWGHTSNLLAMLFNRHRSDKEKPLSADDFHPMRVAERQRARDAQAASDKTSIRDLLPALCSTPTSNRSSLTARP